MANNPYIAKKQREELEQQIKEYFATGKEVVVLGNEMRKEPVTFVINPQKISGEKLPPSFTRNSYQ